MPGLNELLKARERLQEKIDSVRKKEKGAAISKIKDLMATFGITVDDLKSPLARGKGAKGTVKPKYYNPGDKSQTWSGRGIAPAWAAPLKKRGELERYRIKE